MPPLGTTDFDGVVTPADLQLEVVNRLLVGAPFARSLDPLPTDSGVVSWPTAAPTSGNSWVAEGAPLPVVDLQPGSYTVVVKKVANTFDISSEMIDDAAFPIGDAVGDAVAGKLGRDLDDGVINGGTPESPVGVWGLATAVDDGPLWPGIWEAVGEMGDAGGNATHVALRPSTWAAEAGRVDNENRPLYRDGLVVAGGLTFVRCPTLLANQALIYDASTVRLIVRRDFRFELDPSAGFRSDTVAARVIGRFAIAVPVVPKSLRKLTITDGSRAR
jgi:HK97 family phage major capsid protein